MVDLAQPINKYVIYAHRNKINNKYYIGQTCQKPECRWGKEGNNYKNQPKFYAAILKYGWDNFEHIILDINLNQEQANEREKYYIIFYDSLNNGYNATDGGKNRTLSEEEKRQISIFMSRKQLGKNNSGAKSVICLNTLQQFDTLKEASEWAQIAPENISSVCKGRKKTAGVKDEPLFWCFTSEFNEEKYQNYLLNKEQIIKQRRPPRRVIQLNKDTLEEIREFENCTEAAECITGNRKRGSKIQESIKRNGTAYGYKWRYVDNA